MSSRGRGNGRGNKRKYPEHNSFNSKKRNFDEGYPRHDRRWNDKYRYNANNTPPNYSSRNEVHNRDSYRSNQHYKVSSHRNFDYVPLISTDSHIEQDKEMTGNSPLNTERLEKVLATKKRIEEAFATKSINSSNQEMAFEKPVMKETSIDNKDKNTDGGVTPVNSLDLRLTNSDFKEIGSVASGVEVEGETDVGDLILNVAQCSSQQRSFNKVVLPTMPSLSKQPRMGGWNVTALSDSETAPLFANPHAVPPRISRTMREQYLQESREEILGSIVPNIDDQSVGPKKSKTGLANQRSPRMSVSRVGQLYHSFLRSRLFGGFTLKLSKNTSKPTGPNPLLDKSVLESHNYNSISENPALQLEMPRPIMIKLEANKATDLGSTPDCMEAEEANEFCQEFSHLLTEPNFLIPSEELEKLGLGHLAEMNKLVNERRSSGGSSNTTVNSESYLRVRSLNALNSVTENDITYNPPTSNITSSLLPESPLNNSFSNTLHVQNNLQDMNYEFVNVPGPNEAQINGINTQALTNPQSSASAQDATLQDIHTPVAESLSVESVAEKVINKLFSTGNINPQVLNPHAEFLLRNQILQSNLLTNQNEIPTPIINNSFGKSPTQSKDPTNQMQDIGSRILRMFVIDKQIEELIQEKKDIYKELFSIGEISSSLFNSWAQEQIQKRNPRNTFSEQPNDSTSNYHTNPLANMTRSVPGFLNEGISKSVQNMVVEPSTTNNSNDNINSRSGVSSLPSQRRESHHNSQPKFSVRTDLHSPNQPPRSNDLNKKTGEEPEVLNTDAIVKTEVYEAVFENPLKKSKKKKKGKDKGKPQDVIYLIDDSTDEESCNVSVCSGGGIGVDPLANEEPSKLTKNEQDIFNYDLNNNSPSSICLYKGALIVGCRDGTVLVFDAKLGSLWFSKKVHKESVNCIAVFMKQAVFGSSDATICLFSLENQQKTGTFRTPSSVQCVEEKNGKLYVGTKNGQLIIYKINVKTNEKGTQEWSLKNQETKKISNSSILGLTIAEMEHEEVIIVASRGEQIAVYYTDNGTLLTRFDWCDTVHCLTVLDQTPLVYCGTNTHSIKVVNFVTGANEPDCLVGIARSVTKIVFKSTVLFAASMDGKVYIYDTTVNKLITAVTACRGQIIGMLLYKRMIIVASNRCEMNIVPIPPNVEILLKKPAKSKSNS